MTFKQKIRQHYQQLVQDRIDVFKDMIVALTEDSKSDAKGSAGDKHETALSMMHIEQEKLNHKLKEVLGQKNILDKIDSTAIAKTIILGSLVKANGIHLYLSAALPNPKMPPIAPPASIDSAAASGSPRAASVIAIGAAYAAPSAI